MAKKTINEFKEVFAPIKKPKLPKGISSKDKDMLEKDIKGDKFEEFATHSRELYAKDKDYFVDLVAYKLAKHFDNDERRPVWLEKIPAEAKEAAIRKIVPGDINDPLTRRVYDKAVAAGNQRVINLLKERDRNGVDQLQQAAGIAAQTKMVVEALTNGTDEDALNAGAVNFAWLGNDDLVNAARVNPQRFFRNALLGFKDDANFVRKLGDADLRARLKALDPVEWARFEQSTPMLATLARAEAKIEREGLRTTQEVMAAMFEAVVSGETLPLSYAATQLDPNNTILSGPTEKSAKYRAEQKRRKDEEGDVTPDLPATDCHHLLYITEAMMKMVPGHAPEISNRGCPNMLMTRPLSDIPGNGLLDRKFAGNVFDESKSATGRVFFTGDNGINSHTWLVLGKPPNELPFDPVLGTMGDDVAGAVEDTFDWLIPGRLAKSSSGNYAIADSELDKKVKGNAMGFSRGYLFTKSPAQFLTEDEKAQANLG